MEAGYSTVVKKSPLAGVEKFALVQSLASAIALNSDKEICPLPTFIIVPTKPLTIPRKKRLDFTL